MTEKEREYLRRDQVREERTSEYFQRIEEKSRKGASTDQSQSGTDEGKDTEFLESRKKGS